jgi:SAM-dependent methyltransferase
MLLATTNLLCSDVAVVPFLWVLPLALYLLSFILCFQSDRLYWRPLFWPLLGAGAAGMVWLIYMGVYVSMWWQILGYSVGLFACCMICHGELARLKPSPRRLTSFYLASSAGGALGGVLVTILAPLVLPGYFELHAGLWASVLLAAVAFRHERGIAGYWQRRRSASRLFWFGSTASLAALGFSLGLHVYGELQDSISVTRNFYGVLKIEEYSTDSPAQIYHVLRHGRILHGCQFVNESMRRKPTEYYWEKTGVGLAILNRRPDGPAKVGVVGLGVGTLAAYGRAGDEYRFYEINPDVKRLATSRFTYLGESGARCQVVMGDARLSLEREPPQGFDVLALDAFTSDAIPVHLLTHEAFEIYRRHLKPDGVLAVHISNRFLDLQPVVLGLAEHFRMATAVIEADDDDKAELSHCTWILVTDDRSFLASAPIRTATEPPEEKPAVVRLWTDDYSDLFSILK